MISKGELTAHEKGEESWGKERNMAITAYQEMGEVLYIVLLLKLGTTFLR